MYLEARGPVFHRCVLGASPSAKYQAGLRTSLLLLLKGKVGMWEDFDFQLQKSLGLRMGLQTLFTQKKVPSSSCHQVLPGHRFLPCGGPQAAGQSVVCSPAATVALIGVTLLPAASGGKHLQEKSEPEQVVGT